MSRFALSIVVLFLFALPAQSAPITFTAEFSGLNENPANASPGLGQATVVLDPVAHTLEVLAVWADLGSPTTISHIHCCAVPGVNAGVATAVPTFPGFPVGVTSGLYAETFDTTDAATFNPMFVNGPGGGTIAGAEAALLAGLLAGQAYFNIHTEAFPGGEIRANLTAVPEPVSLILLGLGAAGLALRRRHVAPWMS